MSKKIMGVVCDVYKTPKFQQRLEQEGFVIVYNQLMPRQKSNLFKVEVDEENFEAEKKRLETVLKQLEIEIKHSN